VVQPHIRVDVGILSIGVLQTSVHANNDALLARLLDLLIWVIPESSSFAQGILVSHVRNLIRTISDLDTLRAWNVGGSRSHVHAARRKTRGIRNLSISICQKSIMSVLNESHPCIKTHY
jgi:hypothetical protein